MAHWFSFSSSFAGASTASAFKKITMDVQVNKYWKTVNVVGLVSTFDQLEIADDADNAAIEKILKERLNIEAEDILWMD